MRSLRILVCTLILAALTVPLSLCVFADGTDTVSTAADTDTVTDTAADASAADTASARTDGATLSPAESEAVKAIEDAAADPQVQKDYAKTVVGLVGSTLVDRYAAGDVSGSFWLIVVACFAGCIFVSYFLGSVNFGIIVSKAFHKEDIRSYGSGNAGSTNMLRTYGKRDAAITFAGDVLKCVAAVALGRVLLGLTGGYIALFCCIVGHAFPVFYKFKGGKGVAAAAGGVAALYAGTNLWWIILAELAVFILVVAVTRFISLGSVIAMFMFPLLVARLHIGFSINVLLAFMVSALIIYLHRGNIKRIMNGTESKLSFKHTDKHEKEE